MKTKTYYNHSSCKIETLTRMTCPRCAGFGAIHQDPERCTVCDGKTEVWRNSDSGLTLPIHSRTPRFY